MRLNDRDAGDGTTANNNDIDEERWLLAQLAGLLNFNIFFCNIEYLMIFLGSEDFDTTGPSNFRIEPTPGILSYNLLLLLLLFILSRFNNFVFRFDHQSEMSCCTISRRR